MKLLLSLFLLLTSCQEATRPSNILSTDLTDDLQALFLKEILSAQDSVLLFTYSLNDRKIIQALNQKAEEGKTVTVIVDAKASKYVEKRLSPKINLTLRVGKNLMHQKWLVIDNETVWTGSANMTTESLKMHSNLVQKFVSPPLSSFVWQKAQFISQESGLEPPLLHRYFSEQKLSCWFLPDDKEASLEIKKLLRSAQKTIQVAMYTFTREDFAKEIIKAHNRGVRCEVLLDRSMSQGAGAKITKLFQQNNVPVFISQGTPLLHHKMALIDNSILIHGSANWTKAAFTQNEDYFIVLDNLNETEQKELSNIWQALRRKVSFP